MASALRLSRSQSYVYTLTHRSLHISSRLAADSTIAVSIPPPATPLTERNPRGKTRIPKPTLKTESLLEKSPIHDFLNKVESSKDVITLTEIEYYKPKSTPDPDSPKYEAKYNLLVASLVESFTLRQLQGFSKSYHLPTPSKQRKIECVTAIIEKRWGWPPLAKVKDERGDWTEVSDSQFPLGPEQSFLLMGRDGADLLSLSQRYNVHLSFGTNPMSLRVKGLKGSVKGFETYLNRFKNDLDVKNVSLPLEYKLSSAQLKSISTLSGAYVGTEDGNELRIVFHRSRPHSFQVAMRLAVQAVLGSTKFIARALCESSTSSNDQQSGVQTNLGRPSYSLYPFSPSQPLSWKLSPATAFRLRRVGHWLDMDLLRDAVGLARLAKEDGFALLLDNESIIDIKTYLLEKFRELRFESSSPPLIAASTGHFLFLSLEPTFLPALAGRVEPNVLSQLIKDFSDRTLFNHSFPLSMVSLKGSKEQCFRRLVYMPHSGETGNVIAGNSLTLEIEDKHASSSDSTVVGSHLSDFSCFKKAEACVDLLIPDYRADIRFMATDIQKLPDSHWPGAIKELVNQAKSGAEKRLDIPVMFNQDDLSYVLHSNTYVLQRHYELPEAGEPSGGTFLAETTVNSDSGQSSVTGKLLCENYQTELGWRSFLEQCDRLTRQA